ncbi:hypothetical protein M405DRAFT_928121 [Rhizopogon salebrosus TDB-379]|nr:hypothetical protein M405DRAFT_928121 [Rhizopogon salebrosus TDB-379]
MTSAVDDWLTIGWALDKLCASILFVIPTSNFPRPIHLLPSSSIVTDLQELQCSWGASTFYPDPSKTQEPGVPTSPSLVISLEQREILDNALRVDQSGEIAANWIYRGQITVLGHDSRVGPLIQEMRDQEKQHSKVMDKLQLQVIRYDQQYCLTLPRLQVLHSGRRRPSWAKRQLWLALRQSKQS